MRKFAVHFRKLHVSIWRFKSLFPLKETISPIASLPTITLELDF